SDRPPWLALFYRLLPVVEVCGIRIWQERDNSVDAVVQADQSFGDFVLVGRSCAVESVWLPNSETVLQCKGPNIVSKGAVDANVPGFVPEAESNCCPALNAVSLSVAVQWPGERQAQVDSAQ